MSGEIEKQVGVVGIFDDPEALLAAARAVRDAGYRKWDCYTPYAVDGLDRAMGLNDSPVPAIGLGAAFVGLAAALALQGWTSVVDSPLAVGGKPFFSWQAFVPIAFELFVLFSALTIMGCVFVFCKLGRCHSPLHDSGVMALVTADKFAVVIESADEKYDETVVRALLAGAGCRDIRPLMDRME
jgi:hypothetical protein